MATNPTNNPVPSNALDDFRFNCEKVDEIVNSDSEKYADRFGVERYTIDGVRKNLIPLGKQYMTLEAAQADIANIPVNSTTYVRSQDGSALADEYINNGGTLEATGRSMPSQETVNNIDGKVDDLDGRTSGIKSFSVVDNMLIFLAENGAIFTVDATGLARFVELRGEKVSTGELALLGGRISDSPFPLDIKDNTGGRVLLVDGTGKLHGIECDFEEISLNGTPLSELFEQASKTNVKVFRMGFLAGYFHFAFYGQSQVIGTSNGTIHASSFIDNELMLNGGLKSYGTPGYNTSIAQADYYTSLRRIYEVNGETYCSGMAITARAYINAKYPGRDINNIYTVNGTGGATVDMLKKGSASYNRMITQHVALINLLSSMGEAYHFPAFGWSQGGSDDNAGTDPDVWETAVEKLRIDYNADILAATGVHVEPVWIINQINNYMRYPVLAGKPNIGLRQHKMVTDGSGKYAGACPTYICDFIDVAHWTKESQVKVGAYYEKTRRAILEKGNWNILSPIRITTIGKFSTVQFHLPEGKPLQFNTEFVAEATNYGFSAEQADGTPIGIDRVRLVSDDTVEIRYTEEPLSGAVLMYGQTGQIGDPNAENGSGLGRTNGMRGNLCDTAGDEEKIYVSESEPEYPLHNWCWMFTQPMFTESMGV